MPPQPTNSIPRELSIEESVERLIHSAPKQVQDFLMSSERDRVLRDIPQKYRLQSNQSAVFSRDLLFMLLGVIAPADFMEGLKRAGVGQSVIDGIANDLNERVFIPLSKQGVAPAIARATPAPPPNLPGAMPDNRLLPDHEVGHIEVRGDRGQVVGSREPSVYKAPLTAMPQVPPRPIQFTPPRPPAPPQRAYTNPPPPTAPPPKPIASYGADPYREPFGQ